MPRRTRIDKNTYELISGWLQEYHSSTNKYQRTKVKALIVTNMIPVIKKIARTIARRANDPVEDLVQAGAIGLLKAIDSYSEEISENFRIYAGYLIIGEMKHYLRDKLNTIRVPRHIQELVYRINSFTRSLTAEEMNELTNDDVAGVLKISSTAVDFALLADRRRSTLSLEELYNSDPESLTYEEVLYNTNYEETRDLEDAKIILRDVIKKLPDEYKKLVELYYYKDMSKKEIADYLNLTPMQISRRFKKAFSILYKMITEGEFSENNDDEINSPDDTVEV